MLTMNDSIECGFTYAHYKNTLKEIKKQKKVVETIMRKGRTPNS